MKNILTSNIYLGISAKLLQMLFHPRLKSTLIWLVCLPSLMSRNILFPTFLQTINDSSYLPVDLFFKNVGLYFWDDFLVVQLDPNMIEWQISPKMRSRRLKT